LVWPSLALLGPESVTVGATLATLTLMASVLLAAPSESATWTLTVVVLGPSRKVTSKPPDPVAGSNVRLLTAASGPAVTPSRLKVSWPGSPVVKV
jgi:hypothetical protein